MRRIILCLLLLWCFTLSSARFKFTNLDLKTWSNSDEYGITIKNAPSPYSIIAARSIGDYNGDGIGDVLVKTYRSGDSGVLYVVFGKKKVSTDIDLSTFGDTVTSSGFKITGSSGEYTTGAGDLNGDGFDDILINYQDSNTNLGSVYVIFGTNKHSNVDVTTFASDQSKGFKISTSVANSGLGTTMGGIGDVNGDKIDDIILGVPGLQSGADTGAAYIVFGTKDTPANIVIDTMTATRGVKITRTGSQNLGIQVSGAGDINGDEINDFMVAEFVKGTGDGTVFVIFGTGKTMTGIELSGLKTTEGFKLTGNNGMNLGSSLSAAGDVNGDKIDDIVLGAQYENTDVGAAYVIFGTKTPADILVSAFDNAATSQGFKISGDESGDLFGFPVRKVGDMNADGYADIIIGAKGAYINQGAIYVIYGSATPSNVKVENFDSDNTQGLKIYNPDGDQSIGGSIDGGLDFNRDSGNDIIICAEQAGHIAGEVYIIFGIPLGKNFPF